MPVLKLVLAYDGTRFRGWARQPGQRTIQGTLERALEKMLGKAPRLSVAGRTDAGVHARGQVVSLRTGDDPLRIQRGLNGMLAPEVVAWRAERAPEGFDARRSARAREYRYRVWTAEWPDPFRDRYVWHLPQALRLGEMRRAARWLEGEHDFASFCRAGSGTTVRRLHRVAIRREGDLVEFRLRGNAFLHQMVRSIVGTLVDVGRGRKEAESMAEVLAARSRRLAGHPAPARGLTLERVLYRGRS